MSSWRGAVKRVFGVSGGSSPEFTELSFYLPRLFVLHPDSGIGLRFLRILDELSGESPDENLRDRIAEESKRFSDAQKQEFEDLIREVSSSAEDFLAKLSFFVEVQSSRLKEIEEVRKSLESAQSAKTLEETRQQLAKGMGALQTMVETELQRKSDLCVDRDAYASRLEDKLEVVERESRTDALTGVANRAGCIKKLEAVLDYTRTNHSEFCVALLDLNRFKSINDTLGHAAGDAALTAFARRLENAVGKGNFVGRLAGDEFLVIAQGAPSGLSTVLNRLIDQFRALPASYKGLSLDVSFCFGICKVAKGMTPSELLEESDRLLYRHKNSYYEKSVA